MTPDEELNIHEAVEALQAAGIPACIIWPHEEVVAVEGTEITVFDQLTDSILTKHPL